MKKVVIVGGGFTGALTAKKLEKSFDVTLIDTKDYFEFTPGILRTIVSPSHIKKVQVLHNHYLKKADVIRGYVNKIDSKKVYIKDKSITYDYLVIASGSRYSIPIKEANIIIASRASHLRESWKNLCKAKNIVIIGGGLVGVELTGEILDRYKNKNITIIHKGDRLIERNHQKTITYADKFLRKKGVKIILNEEASYGKNLITTNKGTKIKADLVFICTGVQTNFEFLKQNFAKLLDKKKRLKVNDYLQVEGYENIFAGGDITSINEEKLAQNAERHARLIAKNIKHLENNEELEKYIKKERPIVISLGRFNGVIQYKSLILKGLIPGLAKTIVERVKMMRYM